MKTFWLEKNAEKYKDYLRSHGKDVDVTILDRRFKHWCVYEVYQIDYEMFSESNTKPLFDYLKECGRDDIPNPIARYAKWEQIRKKFQSKLRIRKNCEALFTRRTR